MGKHIWTDNQSQNNNVYLLYINVEHLLISETGAARGKWIDLLHRSIPSIAEIIGKRPCIVSQQVCFL